MFYQKFDVQVSQTTINMIKYLLISIKFRQQVYATIEVYLKM